MEGAGIGGTVKLPNVRRWFFAAIVYAGLILGLWASHSADRAMTAENELINYKTALITQRLNDALRFLSFQLQGVADTLGNCASPTLCAKAVADQTERLRQATFAQARNFRLVVLNAEGAELLPNGSYSLKRSSLAASPCYAQVVTAPDVFLLNRLSIPYNLPGDTKPRACMFHPLFDHLKKVNGVVIADFTLEDLRGQIFPYRLDNGMADDTKFLAVYGQRSRKIVTYLRSENYEPKDPMAATAAPAGALLSQVLADQREFAAELVSLPEGGMRRDAIQATARKLYVHYGEKIPPAAPVDPVWWVGLGFILLGFMGDVLKPILERHLGKIQPDPGPVNLHDIEAQSKVASRRS